VWWLGSLVIDRDLELHAIIVPVADCGYPARYRANRIAQKRDRALLLAKYRSILARPGPLVLDRSFVSELVYGPLEHIAPD
jgi:hypothetical protein